MILGAEAGFVVREDGASGPYEILFLGTPSLVVLPFAGLAIWYVVQRTKRAVLAHKPGLGAESADE